jgi:arabinan endo-1,5-alpha-L-arabinosidase
MTKMVSYGCHNGSWSGGIFILKLNAENGLRDYTATYPIKNDGSGHPLSDPYFGTQIAGGYYVSGEGSYIEHIGDFYYLFVTYGGLEAAKGYTMRTFYSKNPDGPYVDNSGESAVFNRYQLNFGPNDATKRAICLSALSENGVFRQTEKWRRVTTLQ